MPVAANAATAFEEGGSFKYYTLARAALNHTLFSSHCLFWLGWLMVGVVWVDVVWVGVVRAKVVCRPVV